jgi:hypothetical protein
MWPRLRARVLGGVAEITGQRAGSMSTVPGVDGDLAPAGVRLRGAVAGLPAGRGQRWMLR